MNYPPFKKQSGLSGVEHNKYNSNLIIIAALILLFAYADEAFSFGEDLFISGFISQGYLISTGNNYLITHSKRGSAEFNEVALNIYAVPSERLRFGIQYIARDLGMDGNNASYVDWAYGDYHWRDCLGARFGKIKFPSGLYNYERDADMLRTSILMPESVYAENWRDFTLAVEGASVYGNFHQCKAGEFDYEFFGGTLNVPNPNSAYWSNVYSESANEFVRAVYPDSPDGNTRYVIDKPQGLSVKMPWVYGGGLFWKTPLPGLKLGFTKFLGRYEINFKFEFYEITKQDDDLWHESESFLLISAFHTDYEVSTSSIEYSIDKWTLAAEYSLFKNYENGDGNPDGYYVQVTNQTCSWLSLGAYYSYYNTNSAHNSGTLPEEFNYFHHQNDFCFSSRIDLTENWLLKLEAHAMEGAALVKRIQNPGSFEDPSKIKKDWMLFVAKTTFHF